MAIIAVSNFKGGVAKTTTAVCVATLLSEDGDVLVIDADQNQSAVIWASAEKLPFTVVTEKASRKVMTGKAWTHIIIDSQAAPGTGEVKALMEGSDLLIVPTSPDAPALAATGRVFNELPEGNAIALITMVPPKPQLDGDEAARALTTAEIKHFDRKIRYGKAYKRAFETGVTVPGLGSQLRAKALWRDWENFRTELQPYLEEN